MWVVLWLGCGRLSLHVRLFESGSSTAVRIYLSYRGITPPSFEQLQQKFVDPLLSKFVDPLLSVKPLNLEARLGFLGYALN